MSIRRLYTPNRRPDASSMLQARMRRLVPYQQSPTFWYRADAVLQDPGNGEAGVQARVLIDLSGNRHHAIQETDSKQGTVGTDADGNAEIAVDGAGDGYSVSAGAGWPSGTSHSFYIEYDTADASRSYDNFIDFQTGRLVVRQTGSTAGIISFYDGTERSVAVSTTGEQSLEFHLDDAGNTGYVYRDGKLLGSATYGSSASLGGTVGLFATFGIDTHYAAIAAQELWWRASLQSNAEIFASRQYRATRYPTRWASTLPLVVPVATSATAGAWFDTRAEANFVNEAAVADALTNGDFETGSPPSNWTAGGGATLTAQPGARTGGSGSQVLRVEAPGGDAQTWAAQNAVVNGSTYHVTGWAKGDGTNGYPRLVVNGVVWWNGTTSTDWQYFDVVNTTTGIVFSLMCQGNAGTTDYAYFDDVECILCPPIIVAKDCSRDVDDPVSNGDFETGDPPTGWSSGSGATLSQQNGTRTGGSGAKVIRATIPIADNYGGAYQGGTLVMGQRYLVDVWARGNGANGYPRIRDGGGTYYWDGTTANSWQHAQTVITTTSTYFTMVVAGDNATEDYAEFDDLVVTPGNHGYQATSANRPTYDSVNKLISATAANSEFLDWGTAPPAAGVTFSAWVRMTDLSSAYSLWGSIDAGGDACYVQVQTNGKVRAVCGTGGSNATFDSTATLSAGTWAYVAVTISTAAITITIDDTTVTSGAFTETLSTADTYLCAHNNNGAAANHLNGDLSLPMQIPHVATSAMISYLYTQGRT